MKKLQNIIGLKSILAIIFTVTFSTGVALASVNNSGVVTVGAQTGSLTSGVAGSATYSVSTTGNGNGAVTWSVGPLPANVFASFSPTTTPSGNGPWTSTLTITTNISAASTAGTGFIVTATGDGSLVASSMGNLVIGAPLTPQTIDFPVIADKVYGDADFVVAATSTSGLTVAVTSATAGVCTVAGFTVHIVSAGTCTLRANQAGNGVYAPAAQVIQSFNVAKKNISIASGDFAATSKVYDGTTNAVLNAVPSGVTFSGVIVPDVVTIDATGAIGSLASKNVSAGSSVTFSGYILGGANAANYNLTAQPASELQAVTAFAITVRPSLAASKVYDGNTNSSGVPTITVGALQTGDIGFFTQNYVTAIVGNSKNINATGTVFDGNNGQNYVITFSQRSDAVITAKGLTVTGVTANNKVYDGTDGATSIGVPTLVGLVPGDTSNVTLGGSMFLNFNNPSVGVAKPVTVTGLTITGTSSANYTLTQPTLSADITRKELTVSGLSAANKVYNQNTNATISGVPVLNGGVSADALPAALSLSGVPSGAFLDKNVGNAKLVNISGLSITGTSISNYILTAPTSTANITAATLTINASGTSKVYDGNTSAVVTYTDNRFAGDVLTVNGTANFNNKNVANAKTITVTGVNLTGVDAVNYVPATTTLTTLGNVYKKDMTVTVVTSSKVYDATVIASTTLSSADKVAGDTVIYNRTSSNFADKNVGVAKVVTTNGITITGTDAANYNLLNLTATSNADITARTLVVTPTAVNKVYDSNTTAAISSITSNVISGDTIGTLGSASANFSDKNVGTGKLVTVNIIITPAVDNTNYTIPAIATTTANITKRTLTVTATGINKVYDGNTGATVNFTDNRLAGDTFTIASSSANFADKNVGTGKLVNVLGISLTGLDSGNYNVAPNTASTTANITAKSATITAENKIKVYGTADPVFTATTTGLVAPDTLTGSLTRVAGENVGTYDITAGTITAGSNYSTTFATGALTITKANQTITITPIANKNPDDAAFNVIATTTSGLPITFSLGAGVNKCTIVGNLVTLTGATGTCQIVADQAGNSNYNAAPSASITINIIDTKPPVITLVGDATTTVFVGSTYNELGAIAVDFVDGTTTAVVSGDVVNTAVAGTYIVRYNATDSSGNVATERTRTVIVLNNGGLVSGGGSIGGIIYSGTITVADLNTRGSNGGVVLGASKFRFTKNLKLGMKNNNDVKELQKVLITLGFYKGSVTGNFDIDTYNAVKAYQTANKINPASGYFGPLTRAVINK